MRLMATKLLTFVRMPARDLPLHHQFAHLVVPLADVEVEHGQSNVL